MRRVWYNIGVLVSAPMLEAFVDELEKIATSHGRMRLPKERKGRRPMSVTTLLRKEKDGTLFKESDAQGRPESVRGAGADDPGAAALPRRLNDGPTRGSMVDTEAKTGGLLGAVNRAYERYYNRPVHPVSKKNDLEHVDRMDGRGEATTITGLAQRTADIGVGGGEHY